jgi:hypothetical protein
MSEDKTPEVEVKKPEAGEFEKVTTDTGIINLEALGVTLENLKEASKRNAN